MTYLINIFKKYPLIEFEKLYDFILESIQYIQDFYKFKRKPYTKYVPYLYNFYPERDMSIPIIQNFIKNKDLIIDQKVIDKLNELYIKYSDNKIIDKSKNIKSDNINIKPVDDEKILNKYYYFNKTKNKYFKKQDIVNLIIVAKLQILKMKIIKNIANNIRIITLSTLIINQKL